MHTKQQEGPRIVKFIEVESRIMVTRGWRQEGSQCLMEIELLFGKMKHFWRWVVVMIAEQLEYTMPLNCILEKS